MLWFDNTSSLETYLFTGDVRDFIGTDISSGFEYRPLLNNNIMFIGGLATLISGNGFEDLFQNVNGKDPKPPRGFRRSDLRILNLVGAVFNEAQVCKLGSLGGRDRVSESTFP